MRIDYELSPDSIIIGEDWVEEKKKGKYDKPGSYEFKWNQNVYKFQLECQRFQGPQAEKEI